jgi:hypothetical protein
MTWAILTTIGTLATLFGFAHQLYTHKEKPFTYSLLMIALLFAVVSTLLWSENTELEAENSRLQSAKLEAVALYDSWPKSEKFEFISGGELQGIVISGLAFLEANKAAFPETYIDAKKIIQEKLDGASNDENFISKRSKLQEAAQIMSSTVKSLRLKDAKQNM